MRHILLASMLGGLVIAAYAVVTSSAHTVVDTKLRATPYTDAQSVATLANNTSVNVITRQGGWYNVTTDQSQKGWLTLTSIKFTRNAIGQTWGTSWYSLFESGREGANGATSTVGVRGLNTGTLEAATPAPDAVSAIGAFAADADHAAGFAQAIHLSANTVPYLGDDKEQDP